MKSGPHLVVFGAIHGDEVCGPRAIRGIIADLEAGNLTLASGSVTFVPICNPEAHAAGKRSIDENLNRVFCVTDSPQSYEARLANELCPLMTGADVFLDIHSQNAPGPVSLFTDYPEDPRNRALAAALPSKYVLLGWPAIYEETEHDFGSYSTNRCAHENGAAEVLIECGQNEDPEAAVVAREVILRTLAHLNMIDPLPALSSDAETVNIRMKRVYAHEHPDDRFEKEWEHLELVSKGTCIAVRATGERIVVDCDSIVIFPKVTATPGEEWFYLGEVEPN